MPWSENNSIFRDGWMKHYDGKPLAVLAARTSKKYKYGGAAAEETDTAAKLEPKPVSQRVSTRTPHKYRKSGSALDKIKSILKNGIVHTIGK